MTFLPRLAGRVAFVFDEPDFDVDQIIGVENIKIQDADRLAELAMRRYDPDFKHLVRQGDLIVGGANFGFGHPHYPPMIAMRRLGIRAVIADSFSPGYWRGEISMGFPQIACPGALKAFARWDHVAVDWEHGVVRNETQGLTLAFDPYSRADLAMIEAGGLVGFLKRDLAEAGA